MYRKRYAGFTAIVLTAVLTIGAAAIPSSPASAEGVTQTPSVQAGETVSKTPVKKKKKKPFIVFLDAGHGGWDSGGALGRVEKKDNLRMAKAAEKELKKRGARVIMSRKGDDRKYRGQIDLVKRIKRANRAKASVYVSLHRNAAFGSRASGIDIFIHKKNRKTCHRHEYANKHKISRKMAKAVSRRLKKTSGMKSHIHYGTATYKIDYKVNYLTNMPSCLIEMGFMTNPRDNRLFDKRLKKNAKAIAEGIMTVRK